MDQSITPTAHALAEEINKHYYPRFRRWTRDSAEAKDLCQELLLRAWTLSAQHEQLHINRRLLGVMARNLLVDWWRRRKKQQFEALDDGAEQAADAPPPDESLALARLRSVVCTEVERLVTSGRRRQMLLVGDEELVDIAKRLHTTAATVYSTRQKLLPRLARSPRLRQAWHELSAA